MKAINCTGKELFKAIREVNRQYGKNIRFKRGPLQDNKTGTRWTFTLTVKDSAGPGAKRAQNGRKVHAACWHVHGHFFEALFKINPDAAIKSGGAGIITARDGNWQDRNIGSIINPFMFSAACECRDLSSRAALGYGRTHEDALRNYGIK